VTLGSVVILVITVAFLSRRRRSGSPSTTRSTVGSAPTP
jgi:hypothetical protein